MFFDFMLHGTPAQLAMDYYCEEGEEGKKVKGRAITTLPVVLFNEYHSFKQAEKIKSGKKSNYRQKSYVALKELRKIASNKDNWRKLTNEILKETTK